MTNPIWEIADRTGSHISAVDPTNIVIDGRGFTPADLRAIADAVDGPPETWEWDQFDVALCRIKPRPMYDGRPVKQSALLREGMLVQLTALWQCEEDERYPGEWALALPVGDTFSVLGCGWIASGDVELLEKPHRRY